MKQVLFVFTCLISYSCISQTLVTDSVELQPGITDAVFYQLSSGNKTNVQFNDWHLAVSVRPSQFPNNPLGGTTIRINEAYGTIAYYVPNAIASSFAGLLDTTGWQGWGRLHDSDSSMNEGALNKNRNTTNPFDFGWGVYNVSSHNLVGDSLYLLQMPNGMLRKVWVEKLVYDTAYTIHVADVDGSNQFTFNFLKNTYAGKNFVYLNLLSNSVLDKEPLATDWDLLFLKYASEINVLGVDTFYGVVGVWLNEGVSSGEVHSTDVLTTDATVATFSENMSGIGYDWKVFNSTTFMYDVEDSLVYFVQDQIGDYYRLVLQYYGGSTTGVIRFGFAQTTPTNINEETLSNLQVFPVPTHGLLQIVTNQPSRGILSSLDGEVAAYILIEGNMQTVSLSTLNPGVYFLRIGNEVSRVVKW